MMNMTARAVALTLLLISGAGFAEESEPSDDQIRQQIVSESIRRYSGNCPCPYNRASNGSRCGKRSAYSRPGGASPLCYASDVSDEMVERFRQRLGAN